MCAARAYIMHIIGGVLMPDSNNNNGLCRSGSVVSGALSDDKTFCCRHGRMPYIAAVVGILSDAIFGIGGVFIRVSRGRTLS
ncbi:hypothetical protein Gotur_014766 [Gossypium turneri]